MVLISTRESLWNPIQAGSIENSFPKLPIQIRLYVSRKKPRHKKEKLARPHLSPGSSIEIIICILSGRPNAKAQIILKDAYACGSPGVLFLVSVNREAEDIPVISKDSIRECQLGTPISMKQDD